VRFATRSWKLLALEGDASYENLEESLQAFLNREGPEGLVESFPYPLGV
jgi:hypothetical protein